MNELTLRPLPEGRMCLGHRIHRFHCYDPPRETRVSRAPRKLVHWPQISKHVRDAATKPAAPPTGRIRCAFEPLGQICSKKGFGAADRALHLQPETYQRRREEP